MSMDLEKVCGPFNLKAPSSDATAQLGARYEPQARTPLHHATTTRPAVLAALLKPVQCGPPEPVSGRLIIGPCHLGSYLFKVHLRVPCFKEVVHCSI